MAKTIHRQIFTEDLDKYARFLEASDVNLKASVDTLQKEMRVHQKICALAHQYQEKHSVEPSALEDLVQTTCPDFVTMAAFEQINDAFSGTLETALSDAEKGETVYDCSGVSCEVCWKNYINHMARLLNESALDIKLYDPEDDNDGD